MEDLYIATKQDILNLPGAEYYYSNDPPKQKGWYRFFGAVKLGNSSVNVPKLLIYVTKHMIENEEWIFTGTYFGPLALKD